MKKKHLMIDDYLLDKILDKINGIIGIGRFDKTDILIDTDDKFPDDLTLENVAVLMACAMMVIFLGNYF